MAIGRAAKNKTTREVENKLLYQEYVDVEL